MGGIHYTLLVSDLHHPSLFTWNVSSVGHDALDCVRATSIAVAYPEPGRRPPDDVRRRHCFRLDRAIASGRASRVRDPFRDAFVPVEMVNGPFAPSEMWIIVWLCKRRRHTNTSSSNHHFIIFFFFQFRLCRETQSLNFTK